MIDKFFKCPSCDNEYSVAMELSKTMMYRITCPFCKTVYFSKYYPDYETMEATEICMN